MQALRQLTFTGFFNKKVNGFQSPEVTGAFQLQHFHHQRSSCFRYPALVFGQRIQAFFHQLWRTAICFDCLDSVRIACFSGNSFHFRNIVLCSHQLFHIAFTQCLSCYFRQTINVVLNGFCAFPTATNVTKITRKTL
ncbi:Uncharacterised protein [Shigella flexneri]|nr:Uncharacterised protein [Shigella flexneri]